MKLLLTILLIFLSSVAWAGYTESDGTASYIDTNYVPNIGSTEDFSWMGWVNFDSYNGLEQSAFGNLGSGADDCIIQFNGTDNAYGFVTRDNDNDVDSSGTLTPFSNDRWYCVAGTFDHSDGAAGIKAWAKLPTDSSFDTTTGAISSTAVFDDCKEFFVHARNNNAVPGNFSDSRWAEWVFYDGVELTEAQITNYCNAGIARNFLQIGSCTVGYDFSEAGGDADQDSKTYTNVCNPGTSNATGVKNGGTLTGRASTVTVYP